MDYLQLVQPDADHAGTSRVDEPDAAMRSSLATTQQGATVFAAAAMNRVGRDTPSLGSSPFTRFRPSTQRGSQKRVGGPEAGYSVAT